MKYLYFKLVILTLIFFHSINANIDLTKKDIIRISGSSSISAIWLTYLTVRKYAFNNTKTSLIPFLSEYDSLKDAENSINALHDTVKSFFVNSIIDSLMKIIMLKKINSSYNHILHLLICIIINKKIFYYFTKDNYYAKTDSDCVDYFFGIFSYLLSLSGEQVLLNVTNKLNIAYK